MLSHWIIVPIILPALIAPLLVLTVRYDLMLQRVISLASVVFLLGVSVALTWVAAGGAIEVYEMGNWPAPFGIVMVLDRLSALMVLMTTVVALIVLLYVVGTGWDGRGKHFHALFQFQLMGLYGAMLTGDLFNLFVFFEVLLIASYGLMVHGGGKIRLQAGVQYVIYNLAGSTLFIFALATLYGVTGTLNMADMAVKAVTLPDGDAALLRTGAAMLLMVFAVKGALIPIHFWLPNTYTHAPAPVAALFAIMTKVGAYAVIRVYTMVFGPDLAITNTMPADWIMPAAIVTLIIGMLGVLAGGSLSRVVSFIAIGSMGTLFIAIGAFTPAATLAALYYMVHSTFAGAALFLIVDLIQRRRGSCALDLRVPMAQTGLVAALFFAAAIAATGMPPMSGFLGKLLVLDAMRAEDGAVLIWGSVLIMSLVAILGFARAGSILFWKPHSVEGGAAVPAPALNTLPLVATGAMLLVMVGLTVLAGPVTGYMEATAAQLFNTSEYIGAVLGTPHGGIE